MLGLMVPPFLMCWLNGIYVADRRYDDAEQEVLCSCEYVKSEQDGGGKGHLLDCVDDYERLDACSSTACRRREAAQLLHTVEFHFARIPWIGGARRVERQFYPAVLVPLLVWFGSMGIAQNLLQALCTFVILIWCMVTALRKGGVSRSAFLPNWLVVDHVVAFIVFALELGRKNVQLLAASTPPFFLMLYLHHSVRTVDPGVISKAGAAEPYDVEQRKQLLEQPEQQRNLGRTDFAAGDERPRCMECNIVRPPGTKHCRACNHCVRRFDHHCPAMNCCIGAGNHRSFVLYLITSLFNAAMYLWSADRMGCTSATCPLVSSGATHTMIWGMATTPLLLLQLYQISLGVTTNERLNSHHDNYRYLKLREGNRTLLGKAVQCPRYWWRFLSLAELE